MQLAEFQIYNSLSRKKEKFKPIRTGEIGIYVCGMTVYDSCHLGHGRVMIAFDTIVRYMRFMGYKVNYVRNITDVDDKIINRARENGEPINQLTQRVIDSMHEEEAQLGNKKPDLEPRATEHIDEMIQIIQTLLNKGFAYEGTNSDVYFKVRKFVDYGKLSGKKLDDLEAGARVEVEEAKQDSLDFVLWKAAKSEEAADCRWQTPWGDGRPGWHIECSAMSSKHLGKTFDIHGGGPDLVFPHHENEIAQSEAANSQKFVNYWMHAGALRVDKEKMSKSLGNFQTLAEVISKHGAEVVRFFLISSHYRSPINYSEENLVEAGKSLTRLYKILQDLNNDLENTEIKKATGALEQNSEKAKNSTGALKQELEEIEKLVAEFHNAMQDDFNTPKAIASLFALAKLAKKLRENQDIEQKATGAYAANKIRDLGELLGILQNSNFLKDLEATKQKAEVSSEFKAKVENLIAKRTEFKKAKNYQAADKIREELTQMGVTIKDTRDGTVEWHKI